MTDGSVREENGPRRRYAEAVFHAGNAVAGCVIDDLIGRGGSSDVYRVRPIDGGPPEAWKVMRPNVVDPDAVHRRLNREFDIAGLFDDPRIIRVVDRGIVSVVDSVDKSCELPWLRMQLVDGGSARGLVPSRDRQPDLARIGPVVTRIGEALDVVHAAGIIHRDVKPANMLVGASSEGTDAVLIDFGIAQRVGDDRRAPATGTIRGSIPYAAPEVLTGQPITPAADEYAFACSVYELLSGTLPYPRATATATIRAHLYDPVPPITSRRRW